MSPRRSCHYSTVIMSSDSDYCTVVDTDHRPSNSRYASVMGIMAKGLSTNTSVMIAGHLVIEKSMAHAV